MPEPPPQARTIREPSYFDAILPLVVLAVLIFGSVSLFGLDAINGPIQVALLLAAMVTSFIILKNGHAWEAIAEAGRHGVSSVVSAIFILFAVGALIGAWNMSGTIPTLVYYGIHAIHPNWFYLATILREEFAKRGLASTNLSRALCDAGSVTSPLIPWNSCGAYMAAVLGVPTMLYLPWCFFNIASPLLTLLLGYTGFRILRTAAPARPAA